MTLTIGILVCDKDAALLPAVLDKVSSRVHIPHEVIVWDNTEHETLPSLPCRVLSHGGSKWKENVRQFEGRKGIASAATGDYVWYIDGDDDFMEVDEGIVPPIIYDTADAIVFPYLMDGIMQETGDEKRTVYTIDDYAHSRFCGGLWNKWLRTSVLHEAYSLVNFSARISIMEDDIALMLFLHEPRNVYRASKVLYSYSEVHSLGGQAVIKSTDEMCRYIAGMREAIAVIDGVYSPAEQVRLLGGEAASFADFITNRVCARLCDALLADDTLTQELITPIKDEVSAYEIAAGLVYARQRVPLDLLPAWAKIEGKARDALGVSSDDYSEDVYGVYSKRAVRRVSFVLDLRCNLNCPYCSQKKERKKAVHISDDDMYSRFDKALTHMEGLGVPLYPQILGGEPTLWSDALITKIARRLSHYPQFLLFTNGTNRHSLWYTVPNVQFLTHITDWAETMTSYKYENERGTPIIVVTHNDVDKLETYLKHNKCRTLTVSPATDARDLTCTASDIKRITDLARQYNVRCEYDAKGKAHCDKDNLVWQIDCTTSALQVLTCCKAHNLTPLEEWTPDTVPDCEGCTVRV